MNSPSVGAVTFTATSRAAELLGEAWALTPRADDLAVLRAQPKPVVLLLTRDDAALHAALPVAGVAALLVVPCDRRLLDLNPAADVIFANAPRAEIELRAERALRARLPTAPILHDDGLRVGDETIVLSASEHRLLALLLARPGLTRSREELCGLLGSGAEEGRALDAHVYRLRRKLAAVHGMRIETLRQRGFRLSVSGTATGATVAAPAHRGG